MEFYCSFTTRLVQFSVKVFSYYFCLFLQMDYIYKHKSDKNEKCLFVGIFRILFVIVIVKFGKIRLFWTFCLVCVFGHTNTYIYTHIRIHKPTKRSLVMSLKGHHTLFAYLVINKKQNVKSISNFNEGFFFIFS